MGELSAVVKFVGHSSIWLTGGHLVQCEMRASHASAKLLEDGPSVPKAVKKEKFEKGLMVKGRNEPATLPRVAHVIARVKGVPVEDVSEAYVTETREVITLSCQ